MLYCKLKEEGEGGGGLLVFEDQKVNGPSNIAMQFTQFCFICALRRQYN